jgi:thiol-disulfide isomerase/thioredoxin
MKAVFCFVFIALLNSTCVFGQTLKAGLWRGALIRQDGHQVVFNFDLRYEKKQPVIYIINAEERLEVRQVSIQKDSVFIEMPFFESSFACQLQSDGSLSGKWIKKTSGKNVVWPFMAVPGNSPRFPAPNPPAQQLNGRWAVTFVDTSGVSKPALAEFQQKGNRLSGSIMRPDGDYRYLDGVVNGDSLYLSTFDGSHAYLFTAKITDANTISGGMFYAGARNREQFSAVKNEKAELSMASVAMSLKPGEESLDFRFPDLNGQMVGIGDERFRNKVVVIQLMGSWCPNCMDETRFLSEYYKNNKQRGVEMIALAYEYSTNTERSVNSLRKFEQKFSVDYPILITGVTSSDSLKTEKTLPQLTPIKSFPSTIFVGKDGKVKKVHGGFFGPATGIEYTKYKQEFEETVKSLLLQ